MFFEDIIFAPMNNHRNNILDASKGFMYGNMFQDEYIPYKNYKVAMLTTNNEKGELLLKLYEYDFALNDLSLYLDIHSDDSEVYKLFKHYTEKAHECLMIYEKKYGPLELTDSPYSSYMWEKGPWPFEGGLV